MIETATLKTLMAQNDGCLHFNVQRTAIPMFDSFELSDFLSKVNYRKRDDTCPLKLHLIIYKYQ